MAKQPLCQRRNSRPDRAPDPTVVESSAFRASLLSRLWRVPRQPARMMRSARGYLCREEGEGAVSSGLPLAVGQPSLSALIRAAFRRTPSDDGSRPSKARPGEKGTRVGCRHQPPNPVTAPATVSGERPPKRHWPIWPGRWGEAQTRRVRRPAIDATNHRAGCPGRRGRWTMPFAALVRLPASPLSSPWWRIGPCLVWPLTWCGHDHNNCPGP
jgi:hypothetical protein